MVFGRKTIVADGKETEIPLDFPFEKEGVMMFVNGILVSEKEYSKAEVFNGISLKEPFLEGYKVTIIYLPKGNSK